MIHSKQLLVDQFTPVSIYGKIKRLFSDDITFLFESAVNKDGGSFSFIIVGGNEQLCHKDNKSYYINPQGESSEVDPNPLAFLKEYYKKIDQNHYKDLCRELNVGFVDGFIGYIGYDMVKEFEPVLKKTMQSLDDPIGVPDLYFVRPKLVMAYSHKNSQMTLISNQQDVASRFEEIIDSIESIHHHSSLIPADIKEEGQFAFSKERFFEMVDQSKEMIRSGDVFQILMSSRFTQKAKVDPFSFYRMLRTKNPSPYLFLMEYEEFALTGSSPEVMVSLQDGQILLRPIAGTRKRGKNIIRERELEHELLNDEKEKAEHLMLVDLGRNDVGRVAKKGTVKVTNLMRVEKYSHVMHMVSDVVAELDEQYDMFDLFAATFTAGTMTGAPKIRAMELIAEFEGSKRGFYSGAIGYFGFQGEMDSGITIRSALIKPDQIFFHAGAGVVADSVPELEYLEVNNKMGALFSSLEELAKQ